MNPWELTNKELEHCLKNPKFDIELHKLLKEAHEKRNLCVACDEKNSFVVPALCLGHYDQWNANRKKFEAKHFRFERDEK